MNWISFSKERPKEEPGRTIWIRFDDGREVLSLSDRVPKYICTHWAEIEGPEYRRPAPVQSAKDMLFDEKWAAKHPKPDPFEEWWRIHRQEAFRYDGKKHFSKFIWDAAMKHKDKLIASQQAAGDAAAMKYKEGK